MSIYILKYQVCLAFQHLDIRTVLKKQKYFVPLSTRSEKRNEELFMRWIESIEQTGNLPSHGQFSICDSHFDGSYFKRDLKIIIPNLLCLFKIS